MQSSQRLSRTGQLAANAKIYFQDNKGSISTSYLDKNNLQTRFHV